MNHAELVRRAGHWLRKTAGCSIVFEELVALTGEIPDAIGWRDAGRLSYLIECKATRGDFLADKRKEFRTRGGVGTYRYFMCPPGLTKADEVPERWGLLYVHVKSITLEAGRHPKRWDSESMSSYYHHADRVSEIAMLSSALNRLRIDLGDTLWSERVHRSYTDRQERNTRSPRRFVFLD